MFLRELYNVLHILPRSISELMKIKEIFVTRYTLLWSGNYVEVLVMHHAPASVLLTGFDGRASIQSIAKVSSPYHLRRLTSISSCRNQGSIREDEVTIKWRSVLGYNSTWTTDE